MRSQLQNSRLPGLLLSTALVACGASDAATVDAGNILGEGGRVDSGTIPRDSGAPAIDASRPEVEGGGTDSGHAANDAGGGPVDASPPPPKDAVTDQSSPKGADAVAMDAPVVADGGATPDPNVPGPYAYAELDDTMNVAASGDDNVAIHCAYPTSGPTSGPYPVIVFAHGDELSPAQYYGYLQRLASFGYVALTVDFPTSLLTIDNPGEAQDLVAGLDWTQSNATVAPLSDPTTSGMTGHSLGGKEALLAATLDPRVKASIALDPVDAAGGMTCTAPNCVTVANLLPSLHIPTGFLGETTDGTGGFGGMSCAPVAENYATFYAQATSPSFALTVANAGHMSFLDDLASCGFVCDLCTAGSAPNAEVNGLAHAYVAAFFERYLRGNPAYDAYLTGAVAQARYVATNEATLVSK